MDELGLYQEASRPDDLSGRFQDDAATRPKRWWLA